MIGVLLGFLLLLSLSAFCWTALRHFAGETDLGVLLTGAPSLALIFLVLGGALTLRWLPPGVALVVMGVAAAVATLAIRKVGTAPPALQARPDGWWLALAGLPGLLLALWFSLFHMSISLGVDDGFFLHTSNMGMIGNGIFPPVNFLGEPLQGHYGKDILTALLARGFGVGFLEMEWIGSCAVAVLHFCFLLQWFRVETGKPMPAVLGAYFAFFASAFGSRIGLANTIDNNNAVAYITLTLASYLILRWWRVNSWSAAVLAGCALGVDALIYEIHFGLMGMALFSFAVFHPKRYKGFAILVATALLLASVEGGAITHLAQKAVRGRAAYQQDTKKSWQSQNVELKFPKEHPFTLRRDNLRPSRFFETKLRPTSASFESSRESAPAWSWHILSCFWYPVWLAPLVLPVLIAQRNLLAGWFFLIGAYSALVPCLVSFGYFEGETARWLFGTSVGLSTAYALTLGQACYSSAGLPAEPSDCAGTPGANSLPSSGNRSVLRAKPARYFAWLVLAWSLWFNLPVVLMVRGEMAKVLAQPGSTFADGTPGVPPGGSLWPRPRLNLAYHHNFTDDAWKVTERLNQLGRQAKDAPTARYLCDYPDERLAQDVEIAAGGIVNLIGLQTGLSGRLPAGISGAPRNRWCSPSLSQQLQARAFWADPQRWRLEDMNVRWLLVDEGSLPEGGRQRLSAVPGLTETLRSGSHSLWTLAGTAPLPRDTSPLPLKMAPAPEWNGPALRPRQPFLFPVRWESAGGGEAWLEFRFLTAQGEEPANPDDLERDRLSLSGDSGKASLHLVAPYFPGRYKLQWHQVGGGEWSDLGELLLEEDAPR